MIIKADKPTDDMINKCFELSRGKFKLDKKTFKTMFKKEAKKGNIYLLIIDNEIKGFADAYKYIDKSFNNILMVNYAAVDKNIKVINYLMEFLTKFGFLNFLFFKKIKPDKYRLLKVDYINNKLTYLNLKEMNK